MTLVPETPKDAAFEAELLRYSSESETERHERHLLYMIASLQRDYQAAIKPYVDELVKIRMLQPQQRVMINPAYVPHMPLPTC